MKGDSLVVMNEDTTGVGYASNNFSDTVNNGAITTRTIMLGVRTADSFVRILGGLTDGNINLNKNIIPIQELGSDETVLVGGRTSPFQMNVSKSYVNGDNLLTSLMTNAEIKDYNAKKTLGVKFMTNIATVQLKRPRDFILFMLADGAKSKGKFICEAKNVMIQNYSFGLDANNEIIFESLVLTGSLFKPSQNKTK